MPESDPTPSPAPEDVPLKSPMPKVPGADEEPRPAVEEDIGTGDDHSDFDPTDLSDDPSEPKRPKP